MPTPMLLWLRMRDDGEAYSIVRRLTSALPPDSYLTLSDGANTSKAREEAHQRYAQTGAVPYRLRSPGQITAFFDGLELLDPGVVPVSQWRPDPSPFACHFMWILSAVWPAKAEVGAQRRYRAPESR